jgi:hypothetical protein
LADRLVLQHDTIDHIDEDRALLGLVDELGGGGIGESAEESPYCGLSYGGSRCAGGS